MCGRYTLTKDPRELTKEISFAVLTVAFAPRYNIAPTQKSAVIASLEKGTVLMDMRWGLIPSWAADASVGNKLINARAETLSQKPAFKSAFERRRCLIPADGFYEWKKMGATKQPMRFVLTSREIFCFAGLWGRWKSSGGDETHSFTVITTTPNKLAETVHDRMPVILKPEHYGQWLDPKTTQWDRLASLLKPYPDSEMLCYPVSPLVNSAGSENSSFIEPVSPEQTLEHEPTLPGF